MNVIKTKDICNYFSKKRRNLSAIVTHVNLNFMLARQFKTTLLMLVGQHAKLYQQYTNISHIIGRWLIERPI